MYMYVYIYVCVYIYIYIYMLGSLVLDYGLREAASLMAQMLLMFFS